MNQDNNTDQPGRINRRDILKGLAALPAFGVLGYGVFKHLGNLKANTWQLPPEFNSVLPKNVPMVAQGQTIRLGIIGCGSRGGYLLKALGYLPPEQIDQYREWAAINKYWEDYMTDFMAQDNLNVKITAICDVFDINAETAIITGANEFRNGKGGQMGDPPKRFRTYKELLASPDVDAVIIATPDHWHVPMVIEAARQGKHVYCEKPLSWTVEETYEARKVVKDTGIVFQLGHQGRQTDSYHVARSLLQKDVIGKISMIEVCTNRNDPNGAWVYDIHPEASPNNIDWKQFIGPAPWHDFSLERFFRWRCWWDYSTGLSGDLFTHEFDAINQILDLGIPYSAVASGGIYFFKDGRTVPDVLNMAFEYPDRDFSLLYSATLASEKDRGKVIMGHDGYLRFGEALEVLADPKSTKYADQLQKGIIQPHQAIFSYMPGRDRVDAITSATEKYFAARGLLYTVRNGRTYDTSHLHLREWINYIRLNNGRQPSCNIDVSFEEAITAHMGTISYHQGRMVYWDKANEAIVLGNQTKPIT